MKLLLLDRDGCLNMHSADTYYLTEPSKINFYQDAISFIRIMVNLNVKIAVVTNQQAIGKGLMKDQDLIEMHSRMEREVGVPFQTLGLYYCPHLAGTCDCRKPSPKLLKQALADYSIKSQDAVMVGDQETDLTAALESHIHFIQLLRAGSRERRFTGSKYIADDYESVFEILKNELHWF